MTTGKTIALARWTFVGIVMSLLFFFFNFLIFLNNFLFLYFSCVPHPEPSSLLPPHTIPLGRPSAPAPSIQHHALTLSSLVTFSSKEQVSFNFMAAFTIFSDFGAQTNKVFNYFHCSPSICHEVMGPDAMIFVF